MTFTNTNNTLQADADTDVNIAHTQCFSRSMAYPVDVFYLEYKRICGQLDTLGVVG